MCYLYVCVLQLFTAPRRSTLASEVPKKKAHNPGKDEIMFFKDVKSKGDYIDAKIEDALYFSIIKRKERKGRFSVLTSSRH